MNLVDDVTVFCRQHALLAAADRVVVAVSGGPDSLTLLHLLLNLRLQFDLTLVLAHFNHQLRGVHADADASFVEAVGQKWQLPVFTGTENVTELARQRRQSLEESARQARYAFLWRVAQQTGSTKIAAGHNADDQAETVLLHLLQGAGLTGLRGITPAVPIDHLGLPANDTAALASQPPPTVIRPLLAVPRTAIDAYCRQQGLTPRQDASNQDISLMRNRLRHELLPYLETYNPAIKQALGRTATVLAADVDFLAQQVKQHWPEIVTRESAGHIEIELGQWRALPLALQRATLRHAAQKLADSVRELGFEHIEAALNFVARERTGRRLTWPAGLQVTMQPASFVIRQRAAPPDLPVPQLGGGASLPLAVPGSRHLPHTAWQVTCQLLPSAAVSAAQIRRAEPWQAYLDADIVGPQPALRARQPGDVFCPLGLAGQRQSVKKFMIDQKIPAAWRAHLPLLVSQQQIHWVCGFRIDHRARITETSRLVLYLTFQAR